MNVSSCGCRSYRSCTSPYPPPLPDLLLKTERLVQVTRITGALSINIAPNFVSAQQVLAARAIIERVNNEFNRTPEAKLTLVSYTYNENSGFPKPNRWPASDPACTDCPPAGPPTCIDDPRQECNDGAAVTAYLAALALVRGLVPDSMIGQQFFDTERWATDPTTPDWDPHITKKHNKFYDAGKGVLQSVPIIQYERGGVSIVDFPLTHRHSKVYSNYYTLLERGDTYGVSLYGVPDLDRMRAAMEATVENLILNAPSPATTPIVPWVGLACGNRDFADKVAEPFKLDWDYGVRAVRDLALWLRYFNPNIGGVPITINPIGLYPEPFARSTPHWMRYFIEYVRALAA